MTSLYWDDFERRIKETVESIRQGKKPVIRRVSIFITDRCNFRCKYCNNRNTGSTLSKSDFMEVLNKYGDTAIIHITGGEPSTVPWLYPILEDNCNKYIFHLNTNAYISPPVNAVRRLKISLDSHDEKYSDYLVGRIGSFRTVVENIKKSMMNTITSITYVLTKESYRNTVAFMKFVNIKFPYIYAVFFSVYKGINQKYVITEKDAEIFFKSVLPKLKQEMPIESLNLIEETIDEKIRLTQGVRFPKNNKHICYLSMSEKVISPSGEEFTCSHLYRDGIYHSSPEKHEKCLYGCNRRLVKFNEQVENLLTPP